MMIGEVEVIDPVIKAINFDAPDRCFSCAHLLDVRHEKFRPIIGAHTRLLCARNKLRLEVHPDDTKLHPWVNLPGGGGYFQLDGYVYHYACMTAPTQLCKWEKGRVRSRD